MLTHKVGKTVIELVEGDITELEADAIVNPANIQLALGGGVAGAVRRKGGPSIQEECDALAPVRVSEAVITGAGKLKARHVIHAAGPRMGEGDEDEKLKRTTLNILNLADEKGLKSLAFPAISTGIFGYPVDRCAQFMLSTTIGYLSGKTGLKRVVFCLYGANSCKVFEDELKKLSA